MAKFVNPKNEPVRFCYVKVFKPSAMEGSTELKYSVSVLIPKTNKATVAMLNSAIEEVKKEAVTAKWKGKLPANLKTPLRDGDVERAHDPAYKGCFFFNATSNNKPGVVMEDLQPLMSEDEFYSGCYGRVSVNFYAFDVNGNRGIAAGLNNLQKLEDGERLDGGATVQEDFGDDIM